MRKATFIAFVLLSGGVIPASADQTTVDPKANALLGALRRTEQSNPYSGLFDPRHALKQATEQASKNATPAPKRKIVCGMTIIEVGPALDPKMAVTPPKDDTMRHTIRAIDPPVCGNK